MLITGNIKDLLLNLSDTKRAQIALDILQQIEILKKYLGESGRTISNIDRDIASRRLSVDLTMKKIQSVAELKQRLER
jgi:transcription initiation factor TFIIIB Brf1 subunit/transcription initiation factor TFIIB